MRERGWTTPAGLRDALKRRWDAELFLGKWLLGELTFPLEVRIRRPKRNELTERFEDVRAWINGLRSGDGAYEIQWESVALRTLGPQQLPKGLLFHSMDALAGFLERGREFEAYRQAVESAIRLFPEARPVLAASPAAIAALFECGDWPAVLAVCKWFRENRRQGVYLRQVDAEGVHTKFIEENLSLLDALLQAILPEGAWDASVVGLAAHGFERRFGLRYDEPSIRCRILDERYAPAGLTDLTIPFVEFAAWAPALKRVFVTENKVNGLAFPPVPDAMVIFGLGNGVQSLGEVPWLRDRLIIYWGDIDTHGFRILGRFRQVFPQVSSMLMDEESLFANRDRWVTEPSQARDLPLDCLTPSERAVYAGLLEHKWGNSVRLEQERIAWPLVLKELENISVRSGQTKAV